MKAQGLLPEQATGLVLTRGLGETIVIGEDILITVISVVPGRVKLIVGADNDIPVDRLEVWQRKNPGRKSPRENK